MSGKFICGVIEGFYGLPWSFNDRLDLFERLKKWGLNTYIYGPKDDYKHRSAWRDLYTKTEADSFRALIKNAAINDITFVYAISPGNDISYSNSDDVNALKDKLDQVRSFGCEAFAIFFDDIYCTMNQKDKTAFASFGSAHVYITNLIYEHLSRPSVFMFCPTEYCATRAIPSVENSPYLTVIGNKLNPEIQVLWTGPDVISSFISVDSIIALQEILKRKPIIWDNIHANDYDHSRIFLGPYQDRPVELTKVLSGVITNPNCEYRMNYVPIRTFSLWCQSQDKDEVQYSAETALTCAVEEWVKEFSTPSQLNIDQDNIAVTMTDEIAKKDMTITTEHLMLLIDIFYLPHKYGRHSIHLINMARWLQVNSKVITSTKETDEATSPSVEVWFQVFNEFNTLCQGILLLYDYLTMCPNQAIFRELNSYIINLKKIFHVLSLHINSLSTEATKHSSDANDIINSFDAIVYGGILGEVLKIIKEGKEIDMKTSKQVIACAIEVSLKKSDANIANDIHTNATVIG